MSVQINSSNLVHTHTAKGKYDFKKKTTTVFYSNKYPLKTYYENMVLSTKFFSTSIMSAGQGNLKQEK